MYKCRPRGLTVRASGDSAGNSVPVSPLEFESPVGQLLAQILQTHPHLLPAAIDQQLENLQADRDAQKEEAASLQDFLYKLVFSTFSVDFGMTLLLTHDYCLETRDVDSWD